jgi:hypothetical protein
MFRHGLPGRVKIFGDGVRRHCLDRDQRNDRSSRRVRYGLKNISFHKLGRKYATKRLRVSSATEWFRKFFFWFGSLGLSLPKRVLSILEACAELRSLGPRRMDTLVRDPGLRAIVL